VNDFFCQRRSLFNLQNSSTIDCDAEHSEKHHTFGIDRLGIAEALDGIREDDGEPCDKNESCDEPAYESESIGEDGDAVCENPANDLDNGEYKIEKKRNAEIIGGLVGMMFVRHSGHWKKEGAVTHRPFLDRVRI